MAPSIEQFLSKLTSNFVKKNTEIEQRTQF